MLNPNNIYDTIIDYLSNQLNEIQILHFEKWLNESDANKEIFENVEKQWKSTNIETSSQKEKNWNKLMVLIAERNNGFIRQNIFSIVTAASIILLIASGWFLNTTTTKMISIITNEDTFITDTLNNGTIIFLYPSSSIEVSKNSSPSGEMQINLTGEAFFIVPPQLHNNIKINVGGASIKVTGTCFRVNENSNSDVLVIVESGSVELLNNRELNKPLLVEAGEEGYFLKADNKLWKKAKSENIYLIYQPKI